MNQPFIVPSAEQMAEMSDDQLAAFIADMQGRIDSCDREIRFRENAGRESHAVRAARTHYHRAHTMARAALDARHGIAYGPVRPVHNFVSAYQTLKAVNRLLGLAETLHAAVTVLLDDDSDEHWQAVERAHEAMTRAICDGGIETLEVAA